MKIHVNRVPDDGLPLSGSYDPSVMDMARADARPAAPITLTGKARKEERELIVEASVRCVLECTCGRCLTCFESVIHKDCVFHYDVSARQVVDVTDDVRQEIMLAYPLIPMCHETCRGLCARCGRNLNESDGAHHCSVEDEDHGES